MTKIIKTDSYTQDKALGLEELLADPSVSTDTGYVYTKDDTTTELYYRSNAGIVKITSGGGLNVPPVDATKLVNSPYEVELSNTDGGLTFRDTVAPTETLGILKLSSNALKNTQFGYAAGETLTTGTGNTIIGYGAGTDLATDSSSNVIIGSGAVETSAVAVDQMVAIGFEAAKANTADGTVAIGYQAGDANTTGTGNTFLGYQAGSAVSSAGYNTYIGYQAGLSGTGNSNTVIGHLAGDEATFSGSSNCLFGRDSGTGLTSGSNNVFMGYNSGGNVTSAGYGVAIGASALANFRGGDYNIAIGSSALTGAGATSTGTKNIAIGEGSGGSAMTSGSYNVLIGGNAGDAISTGSGTVAIGHGAASAISTATGGTYIGYQAGALATGADNTVIGYQAGDSIATGIGNTIIGKSAGTGLTLSSSSNTIIGDYACVSANDVDNMIVIGANAGQVVSADGSMLIGYSAGQFLTTGLHNTFIGYESGVGDAFLLTTGAENTTLGYRSGYALRGEAASNTLIGSEAGDAITTGSGTTAVGYQAGSAVTIATGCTYVGYQAGVLATGANNTVIGHQAGDILSSGTENTVIGKNAGGAITTCDSAVLIGYLAGGNVSAPSGGVYIGYEAGYGDNNSYNTSVGYQAGRNSTGSEAAFFGYKAGYQSTGHYNTAVGHSALANVTSGGSNTAVGRNALTSISTTADNTAIGRSAGSASTGTQCVFVGSMSGQNNTSTGATFVGYKAGNTVSSAAGCTFVGHQAGMNSTGANNTIIGSGAGDAASFSGTDNVAIGYNAMTEATGAANYNTVIGSAAGDAITSGTSNTLIGYNAGGDITTGSGNIIVGPIKGVAASTRTFKVGYHATNMPMFSGVMYDGAGGTDSALTIGAQDFRVYDPVTSSGINAFIVKDGKLSTYGETSPDVEIGGLCLTVNSSSKNTFTMKQKSLNHACADFGDEDTWFKVKHKSATKAGAAISGICVESTVGDNSQGVELRSYALAATKDTWSAATRGGCEIISARLNSGTYEPEKWGSSECIFAVRNYNATVLAIRDNGNIYADGTYSTYDIEDDIKLVQSFSSPQTNPYYDRLKEIGVITDGGMMCLNKAHMLSIGAIGQLFNVIRGLAKRLGVSEDELYELAKQY